MAKAKKKGFSKKTKQALLDDGVPENYITLFEKQKLQLDEGRHIAKGTYRKARSSASSEKPKTIKELQEENRLVKEHLKTIMVARLRHVLEMQCWYVDDAMARLAGYERAKAWSTPFSVLTTGLECSGVEDSKAREKYQAVQKLWRMSQHSSVHVHPQDISKYEHRGEKNVRFFVPYIMDWAKETSKGEIRKYPPWLALAEEHNLIPSITNPPKFILKRLKSKHGYFPILEDIMEKAYKAGEYAPSEEQVYDELRAMDSDDLKFDEEAKTFTYKLKTESKAGEKWSRPVTLHALKLAIGKRTKPIP